MDTDIRARVFVHTKSAMVQRMPGSRTFFDGIAQTQQEIHSARVHQQG